MFKGKHVKLTRLTAVTMLIAIIVTISISLSAFAAMPFALSTGTFALTGLTTTGLMLAVVGLVVVIISFLPIYSSRFRIVTGIIGIVMVIVGVMYFQSSTTPVTTQIGVTPAITIESVAGGTYQYNSASHTLIVPVTANYTSKAIASPTGGVVTFSFVVGRTDTNTSAAVFALTTTWATLTNSTTGTASPSIIKLANGTYEVHYGNQWGGNALISVASASYTTITPTITISASAMLDLQQYGSTDIGISVGGNEITVELLLSTLV